jgi:hypothetical protein
MKILSEEEFTAIVKNTEIPAISLYIPTQQISSKEQNEIRLKNLLAVTEKNSIEVM